MNLTKWLIIFVTATLLLADLALAVVFGNTATISFVLTKWSHGYLEIPFAFGFLMGHFFGSQTER